MKIVYVIVDNHGNVMSNRVDPWQDAPKKKVLCIDGAGTSFSSEAIAERALGATKLYAQKVLKCGYDKRTLNEIWETDKWKIQAVRVN